ncbi:MAG: TlyA family RNA methyltransferase [Acidobacteria bacterium]|nr:TlyA family RNA methyltransferase [Acidobacteriota bacterium]
MAGSKTRLDLLLVARGLAASRERARALILAGRVKVDGQPVSKAGAPIPATARLELVEPDHPYVGRGGVKLARALDDFHVDPAGRRALDVGASTGGFTDVLLRRGAASVIALDVGRNQLAWALRNDRRVLVREEVNARALAAADVPHQVSLVTIDVSFISLRHILPALPPFLEAGADVVALVKPQFEAGRGEVGPGGIVSDPAVQQRTVRGVAGAAAEIGLVEMAAAPAAITGTAGNQEFFLHLRFAPSPPTR